MNRQKVEEGTFPFIFLPRGKIEQLADEIQPIQRVKANLPIHLFKLKRRKKRMKMRTMMMNP
jgi:hypothetical protein